MPRKPKPLSGAWWKAQYEHEAQLPPRTPEFKRAVRWLVVIWVVVFLLGYALHFAALLLPTPAWALALIEFLTPYVGPLARAESVASRRGIPPFPVQVVVVYCAFCLVVLPLLYAYVMFRTRSLRLLWRQRATASTSVETASRRSMVGIVCFCLLMYLFFVNDFILSDFVPQTTQTIPRQTAGWYSTSFGNVTLKLFLATFVSQMATLGVYALWLALTWRRPRGADSHPGDSSNPPS